MWLSKNQTILLSPRNQNASQFGVSAFSLRLLCLPRWRVWYSATKLLKSLSMQNSHWGLWSSSPWVGVISVYRGWVHSGIHSWKLRHPTYTRGTSCSQLPLKDCKGEILVPWRFFAYIGNVCFVRSFFGDEAEVNLTIGSLDGKIIPKWSNFICVFPCQ